MNRAFSSVTLKMVSEDERLVEGIASTPRPDRASDVVEPLGAQFELPLPFLLDHDSREAVGEVEWAQVTKAGIKFRARVKRIREPGAAKDLVDKAWSLLKAGLRKHVSIGFRSLDHELLSGGGYRFKSWEWLELSACAIPMQPDARITGLKNAAASRGGVHVAKLRKEALPVVKLTGHDKRVGKIAAASDASKPVHHVVKLTRQDIIRGKIAAEFEEIRQRVRASDNRGHQVYLTPEAKARAERIEAARRSIEERERRWRNQ